MHTRQTCHAYAAEGGRVIVVMTQREKIGMEALFRRTIPPHKRDGSQFVFRQVALPACCMRPGAWVLSCMSCPPGRMQGVPRNKAGQRSGLIRMQGSPLVPADLKMVSASSAAATVIVSDTSR